MRSAERRGLRLWGVPLRVHPLLLVLLGLAWHTGALRECAVLAIALLAHESAHIGAARALGVGLREIVLTPFGAAARMEGGWRAPPLSAALVALAGPAANIALMLAGCALGWAGWIAGETALRFVRGNALLALCNLLPALPMDGGRALAALVSVRTGPQKAARVFARAGCALALLLSALALWRGFSRGVWNVTVFACSAYIAACALGEVDATAAATAEALIGRGEEMRRMGALPVKGWAISQTAPVSHAVRRLRPGTISVFTLYDDAMRPVGTLNERALLAALPRRAGEPLKELL